MAIAEETMALIEKAQKGDQEAFAKLMNEKAKEILFVVFPSNTEGLTTTL